MSRFRRAELMGILGMHHVAISVPDLEEGLAYYCDVLGFEKVQYGPAEMPDETRKVNEFGWAHISLMVDDMISTYEEMKDKLFFPHPPIRHTVEVDTDDAWTAYCRDPWGNVIELWQIGHEDPFPHAPDFDWRPQPLGQGMSKEERYRGETVAELGEGA